MVWYDSHGLLQLLLVAHSRTSIEEDTTFSFSLAHRKRGVLLNMHGSPAIPSKRISRFSLLRLIGILILGVLTLQVLTAAVLLVIAA